MQMERLLSSSCVSWFGRSSQPIASVKWPSLGLNLYALSVQWPYRGHIVTWYIATWGHSNIILPTHTCTVNIQRITVVFQQNHKPTKKHI